MLFQFAPAIEAGINSGAYEIVHQDLRRDVLDIE